MLLTDFDPGPNDPHRWAVALEAGVAAVSAAGGGALADVPCTRVFSRQPVLAPTVNHTVEIAGAGRHCTAWQFAPGVAGPTTTNPGGQFLRLRDLRMDSLGGRDHQIKVSAFDPLAVCSLERVTVTGWSDTGLRFVGDEKGRNVNGCSVIDCWAQSCARGFLVRGGDANGGRFIGARATDCYVGIEDESFLGSYWLGFLIENCAQGILSTNPNQVSEFVGYVEGDSPCLIKSHSIVRGRVPLAPGSTVSVYNGKELVGAGSWSVLSQILDGAGQLLRSLRSSMGNGEVFSWTSYDVNGAVEEPVHTIRRDAGAAPAWWSLSHGGLAARVAMKLREGAVWFPREVRIGYPGQNPTDSSVLVIAAAAPPTGAPRIGGTWPPGSLVLNTSGVGPWGWRFTAANTWEALT